MRNVIVLLDFSRDSINALGYAQKMFSGKQCSFYLLHNESVVEKGHEVDSFAEFKTVLERLYRESREREHIFFPLVVEEEHMVKTVEKKVKDHGVDLIFAGMKGWGQGNNKIIGNTVLQLMQQAGVNLMLVPLEAKFNGLTQIAFPTDHLATYSSVTFKTLKKLIHFFDSIIEIILLVGKETVLTEFQKENDTALRTYLTDDGAKFKSISTDGGTQGFELQKCYDQNKYDLIILLARNVNMLYSLLVDINPKKVRYHTSTPFMLLH